MGVYTVTSVEYKLERMKPLVYILGRDSSGRREILIDRRFYPYMYVPTTLLYSLSGTAKKYWLGVERRTVDGVRVTQVFFRNPPSLKRTRDILESRGVPTYESDILFTVRYLIDKGIYRTVDDFLNPVSGVEPVRPRVLYLDIEALSRGYSLPDPSRDEVCSVTMYDSYTEDVVTYDLEHESSERDVLTKTLEFIRSRNPDIIVGFNIHFDIDYIVDRCRELDISYTRISPLQSVVRRSVNHSRYHYFPKGIELFDWRRGFLTMTAREYRETTLAFFVREFLKKEKIVFKKSFYEQWREDPSLILQRNRDDVLDLVELERQFGVLDFFLHLSWLIGCPLSHSMDKSKLLDIYLLRLFRDEYVLPRKASVEGEPYTGARVIDPVVGIWDGVVVCDMKQAYPRTIIAYNISPETVRFDRYSGEVKFSRIRDGIIPSNLWVLLKLRDEYKRRYRETGNPKYAIQEKALKYTINAVYGMFGYPRSRVYDRRIAETITTAVRDFLQSLVDFLQSRGYRILYGDTDSVFVHVGLERLEEKVNTLESELREFVERYSLDRGIPKVHRVEIDKVFRRLVILTKKRYAGVTVDGEYVLKGVQAIRSDYSKVVADCQESLLKMILQGESDTEIINYLRRVLRDIRSMDYLDLGRPVRLRKLESEYRTNPFHVRAMRYSNAYLGYAFTSGDKPIILPIRRTPSGYPSTKWIAVDLLRPLPDGFEIDYSVIEEWIRNSIEEILEIRGLSWERVHNLTLDSFLS